MLIKDARDITRKFLRNGTEVSPVLAGDWEFIQLEGRVYIQSEMQTKRFYLTNSELFLSNYIFSKKYKINDTKLEGNYFYTSVGLVTQDNFFIAEDMVEMYSKRISEKDLDRNHTYISDKGMEYIYVGKLKLKTVLEKDNLLVKEIIETDSYLYSMDGNTKVKTNSIKLVKLKEKNEKEFYIDIRSNELNELLETKIEMYNSRKLTYVKCLNTIEEMDFMGLEKNKLTYEYGDSHSMDDIFKFLNNGDEYKLPLIEVRREREPDQNHLENIMERRMNIDKLSAIIDELRRDKDLKPSELNQMISLALSALR